VLDLGGEQLDTSTAMGEAMAHMAMVMAQLEAALISERTREGLAVVKKNGKRLGRPSKVPAATRDRIRALREKEGLGYTAIASRLNAEETPGPAGGRWYAASVRRHAT
jgi:DNA invertase Pin-like site-specific DNA recombinase